MNKLMNESIIMQKNLPHVPWPSTVVVAVITEEVKYVMGFKL